MVSSQSAIADRSHAEQQAALATNLDSFRRFALDATKADLQHLLQAIGNTQAFGQYTLHDVSHVNRCLKNLEWIVNSDTKLAMSSLDWLLITLSVYFHDLGMLVTKREFDNRGGTNFESFRQHANEMVGKKSGYPVRLSEQLSGADWDAFLYEEFVREHHAERIHAWIGGSSRADLGEDPAVVAEVRRLVEALPDEFRMDLALVCLSHHKEDLHDLRKYKVRQRYGAGDEAMANVQFASILLRASDLLDITSSRVPSVMFRVISPANPISQAEWAKQARVRSVNGQWGLDRDLLPDESSPSDTVEVHATFDNPEGYFGLTEYLHYAERQLQQCSAWSRQAVEQERVVHRFLWRSINVSNVEVVGYDSTQFEFTIDQEKILELLTGHRLYGNTDVAVRELAQNAIDAVRIQALQTASSDREGFQGKVQLHWDNAESTLTFTDNGTGMTLDVIRDHLLRVGSSRYQQEAFKELHPEFNPISRFGIGVLTAFMVSDEVSITTNHPSETCVRKLLLRSAQGKYLVRNIEKGSDEIPLLIRGHGTQVQLRVRDNRSISSLKEIASQWLVAPECLVTAVDGDEDPVRIGFDSAKDALTSFVSNFRNSGAFGDSRRQSENVQIKSRSLDGVELAFAVNWDPYYREWGFWKPRHRYSQRELSNVVGICVEGVRVEFNTPGFDDIRVVALANVRGPGSPTTNVARTELERDRQLRDAIKKVYDLLLSHVAEEVEEKAASRGVSMARASSEAHYILQPLLESSSPLSQFDATPGDAVMPDMLLESVRDIKILLLETDGLRAFATPHDLVEGGDFWTVDSRLLSSANSFLQQVPGDTALKSILSIVDGAADSLPLTPILISPIRYNSLREYVFGQREPTKIILNRDETRLDICWSQRVEASPRWETVGFSSAFNMGFDRMESQLADIGRRSDSEFFRVSSREGIGVRITPKHIHIETVSIDWIGIGDDIGVLQDATLWLRSGSFLATHIRSLWEHFLQENSVVSGAALSIALYIVCSRLVFDDADYWAGISSEQLREQVRGLTRLSNFTAEIDSQIYDAVIDSPLERTLASSQGSSDWKIWSREYLDQMLKR